MSYEEIVGLVKETDNLVCAEGVTLSMWYLNEREEFNDMIRYVYEHPVRDDFGMKMLHDYEHDLSDEIKRCDAKEATKTLKKHREAWLTLIQRSELTCRYFTTDYNELFKRITLLGTREYVIDLNLYNFIPQELLEEFRANPMIELGGHKILSYVLLWKTRLVGRYIIVDDLYQRHANLYNKDVLEWTIDKKQLKQLIYLFKRYFLSTTETDAIVKILWGRSRGNIIWTKSTESFVYFFSQLAEIGYLRTGFWGMVITRRLMFCSKKGNIITNQSINTSTYRFKGKNFPIKGGKAIDELLKRFELIKS